MFTKNIQNEIFILLDILPTHITQVCDILQLGHTPLDIKELYTWDTEWWHTTNSHL